MAANDTKKPPYMVLGETAFRRMIIEAIAATIGSIKHDVAAVTAPVSRLPAIINPIGMTPGMMTKLIAQLYAVKSVEN
jgi:hypothetical protein